MSLLFKNYLSLIKFSHTVFALPFALIGFFMAVKQADFLFDAKLLILVIACMVFARSAAMAFNRYIDRFFDAKNPRTASREIPAGIISEKAALAFTIFCCVAFIICTWFINSLCFYLSPVALLVVLGYSYTKRFTPLCHFVLGLGLSLAPVGSYIALTGTFALSPILVGLLVLLWVSGFDIIYALQDDEFDREHKLKSIPVLLGRAHALLFSRLLHATAALIIGIIYVQGLFGWWYIAGSVAFITLLIYQHSIVKPNDLSRVNLAFGTTNGIASIIFCLFTCLDIFWRG